LAISISKLSLNQKTKIGPILPEVNFENCPKEDES